ncbi:MAG: glycosyltransferase family 4 protein [Bacteroidetes bacterium]|nr:glycosyltransferase family 4 protein [Bacteroidota bacterium]
MKRLLVIAPYSYLPAFSGGQKTIAQFLHHLSKELSVTVVSTQKNDASLAQGYTLHRWLPDPFWRYLHIRLFFRLSKLISAEQFDAVLWIHPYYFWLNRLIQKKFRLFTIVHSHNIEFQRFRSTGKWWWPILRLYEGACLKKADLNYFISASDRAEGINAWKLNPDHCDVLPIGVAQQQPPTDRSICRQIIEGRHQIAPGTKILLFNGLLNYGPNQQALDDILQHINPRLLQHSSHPYRLIVCGKNLPTPYNNLAAYQSQHILYAGFVEDIETYFKAADVFLNPIKSGGGVKSKMVEAIGLGTTVISTQTGAIGIEADACGNKLQIAPDQDWEQFVHLIENEASRETVTPEAYYQTYYWGNIIQKIIRQLTDQTTR